jgi:putative endonuclease
MSSNRQTGLFGEQKAREFLEAQGHVVLFSNWRCRLGEIDLITLFQRRAHLIEVKTRRGLGVGHPLEAIHQRKLLKLQQLAESWLRHFPEYRDRFQIDAIAVQVGRGAYSIDHIQAIG